MLYISKPIREFCTQMCENALSDSAFCLHCVTSFTLLYCKKRGLRAPSHMRLRARDHYTSSTWSQVHFTIAQHFPLNCTHTHTMPISSALFPPMPTHSMICAHPCPSMLFKLRPCIQKLFSVYYPPTPSLDWIEQIKGRSLSMASAHSAFWLAYFLHPRSLTPIWSWMQGYTKPNAPCAT